MTSMNHSWLDTTAGKSTLRRDTTQAQGYVGTRRAKAVGWKRLLGGDLPVRIGSHRVCYLLFNVRDLVRPAFLRVPFASLRLEEVRTVGFGLA